MEINYNKNYKNNKLPQGWVECELKDIGEIVSGGTPSTTNPDNFGGDIAWITPADLSNYKQKYISYGTRNITEQGLKSSSAKLMPAGSVLFSSRAPIGYVVISNNPICTNQGFKNIVPSKFVNNEFIYYFLKGAKTKAENFASGTTFKEISGKRFGEIPLMLPPLNEQKRIVEKIEEEFGKIDEGIEKLKLAQEQIKQYRQSVLKSAFEGKLYKTTEWEETELEKIITNSQIGLVRSNAEQSDVCLKEMVPYIKMNNITNDGKYDINKIVYVNASKEEIDKYKLKIGDILFNTRNSYELVGKTTIVNKLNSEKTIYNNNIMRLRFIKNIVPEFMNYQMNAIKFKKYITRAKKATTNICALYSKDLFPSPVNIPTLDEQNQIVREIEKRFEVADEVERVITENLEKAEHLKQSILKKAFEGRLVPQDPTDQPAAVLLEKIKSEKEKNK